MLLLGRCVPLARRVFDDRFLAGEEFFDDSYQEME